MIEAEGRTVKSVETACRIIQAFRADGCETVSEIADELDLSPGTVHTHLTTLWQFGFVVQHDDRYALGPEFSAIGEYVRNQSTLFKAAKEQIDSLADETGEAAHLIIEHQGRLYALYERFGENAVGVTYHTRKRQSSLRHLHCTAAGKAILAHVPEERFVTIINRHGLPRMTPETITKIDLLVEELEAIRARGIAFADEEQIEGLRAVGAPVHNASDEVIGALAVSGPVSRLKAKRFREEVADKVRDAAQVAELTIQTDDRGQRL